MRPQRELEVFAAFVHGALAALHTLGVVYNLRKGNYVQAGIHGAAMGYDLWATEKHAQKALNPDSLPGRLSAEG